MAGYLDYLKYQQPSLWETLYAAVPQRNVQAPSGLSGIAQLAYMKEAGAGGLESALRGGLQGLATGSALKRKSQQMSALGELLKDKDVYISGLDSEGSPTLKFTEPLTEKEKVAIKKDEALTDLYKARKDKLGQEETKMGIKPMNIGQEADLIKDISTTKDYALTQPMGLSSEQVESYINDKVESLEGMKSDTKASLVGSLVKGLEKGRSIDDPLMQKWIKKFNLPEGDLKTLSEQLRLYKENQKTKEGLKARKGFQGATVKAEGLQRKGEIQKKQQGLLDKEEMIVKYQELYPGKSREEIIKAMSKKGLI